MRGWPVAIAWTLTALVGAATLLRLSGAERGVILVQVVSFTPYLTLVALLALLLAGLTRQWWAAGAAGLALLILAALVLPRGVGSPNAATGSPLTVMSVKHVVILCAD